VVFLDVAKAFNTVWVKGLLANYSELPVLPDENHFLVSSLPYVSNILPVSCIYTCHAGRGGSGWSHLPCAVLSICK
jgi:hypothetical protein